MVDHNRETKIGILLLIASIGFGFWMGSTGAAVWMFIILSMINVFFDK